LSGGADSHQQQPPAQPPAQPAAQQPVPARYAQQPYAQQPYAQQPYAQPPYAQAPSFYSQPVQQAVKPKTPGWIWPVMAGTALVFGLLGGTLSAAAVFSSMSDDPAQVIDLGTNEPVAPPLDPRNRSVVAVASQLLPSTVQIIAREDDGESEGSGATGSGFVLDRLGHVITNNHVVAGAASGGEIEVVDGDGTVRSAEIVGRSPVYDIAVLEVANPSLFDRLPSAPRHR